VLCRIVDDTTTSRLSLSIIVSFRVGVIAVNESATLKAATCNGRSIARRVSCRHDALGHDSGSRRTPRAGDHSREWRRGVCDVRSRDRKRRRPIQPDMVVDTSYANMRREVLPTAGATEKRL
jgi:hypothetical protein